MASQITSLTIVYSLVFSGADERKYQSSASLAFVLGIHRWPVNSPHKGSVTRKMFPFDEVIMYVRFSTQTRRPRQLCAYHSYIILCHTYYSFSVLYIRCISSVNVGFFTHDLKQCLSSIVWCFHSRKCNVWYRLQDDSHYLNMITSANGNIFRVNWPFVPGIHWSPVNSPHKDQWRGALMFSLICAWANGRVSNPDAGDLGHHDPPYYVTATNHCWLIINYNFRKKLRLIFTKRPNVFSRKCI